MRSSPTCVRLHSSLPARLLPARRAAVPAAGGFSCAKRRKYGALLCAGVLWCGRAWCLARTARDSSAGPVCFAIPLGLTRVVSWKLIWFLEWRQIPRRLRQCAL